jgi:NAD(P)-dependent dehydrogenase (short-subunit alcohol dehydrogenase family)
MRAAQLIDTVLDRTIAPGYGNIGLAVRRRLPDWPAEPPRMDGKVVLVTGAGSGLGLATAAGFARLGASVRALGRSPERAERAAGEVRRRQPDADVRPVHCDISSVAALREFVARFTEAEDRLDVLVNNAGVMPDERRLTADGVELTFATHVLAPWMLIDGLTPLLAASAPARVINVTSGGQYGQQVPPDDVESSRSSYGPKKIYARTKRAEVIITERWAELLADRGVSVHAVHPGWADTKGVRNWMPVFRALTRLIIRTPEQGADTIVWLGAAPEGTDRSGLLWHDRRPRPTTYRFGAGPDDVATRQQLWTHVAELSARRGVTGAGR